MNSLITRLQLLALSLGLMAALTAFTFHVSVASAQQGGDIYAAADLAPEGADPKAATGTVTFERVENGGTRVTIVVMNAHPNTSYKADIRDGSCSGSALYSLESMQTDADGIGRSVSSIQAEVEFGSWYADLSAEGDAPDSLTLCGQVHPALAGAPPMGNTPGMPSTGQSTSTASTWITAIAAVLALFAGVCLVARQLNRREGGHS